jgi:hypothetical protein
MKRFPINAAMPGLALVDVKFSDLTSRAGVGQITDINGNRWSLCYHIAVDNLAMKILEEESVCSFAPWSEYPAFWSASGMFVSTQRVGLASAFYIAARQLIAFSGGRFISPSDNVTPMGRALWGKIDPSIQWEAVYETGGFRLDLSHETAP